MRMPRTACWLRRTLRVEQLNGSRDTEAVSFLPNFNSKSNDYTLPAIRYCESKRSLRSCLAACAASDTCLAAQVRRAHGLRIACWLLTIARQSGCAARMSSTSHWLDNLVPTHHRFSRDLSGFTPSGIVAIWLSRRLRAHPRPSARWIRATMAALRTCA